MNDISGPKISVIVPVYRVEAYLDKCISSIIGQTYTNLEIILVDDGSPDNCPAMCDAWVERDNRIKVIHKENGGLSDARNAGMAIVTGDLLGFVDSDDWINQDMYRGLYESMVKHNSDCAVCGIELVWEDATPPHTLTRPGSCVLNREDAMRAIIQESWLKQPVVNRLYKTELVKGIPFPVGRYHEDIFWSYQAIGRCKRVSVSDQVGYYYLQHGASIMGEGYSLKRLDALEARVRRFAYIRDYFPALEPVERSSMLFYCIYSLQMAMRYLSKEDLAVAQSRLCGTLRELELLNDPGHLTPKQRLWVSLARCSIKGTCRLRNALKIGL